MADRVKDITIDEFVQMVKDHDDEVTKKATDSNVDIDAIAGKEKPSVDKYTIATGVAYVVARVKEAIVEANSEIVKGMLVGCRDRFGTSAPMRIPVLSSKGDHKEVINWGTTVKKGDSKIEFPFPCTATLKVIYEGEFKGVPNVKIVKIDEYENLSIPDTIARLGKIATPVGEVDASNELGVVVVKGKVAYISPATRWKDKAKDGSWSMWMPNQRDTPVSHPVFQLSLETENNNMVRVTFDRQRAAVPTICVEDFTDMCMDAVKNNQDPIEQAKFVGEIFRGRDVIIVGFMTKYTPNPEVNYIDIGGYAIFDAKVSGSHQEKVSDKPKPDRKKAEVEDEPEEAPAKKEEAPAKKEDKPAKKTSAAASPKAGEMSVEKLKEKIRQYCSATDLSVSDLTPELVMKNLAPGKTKGFVVDVLEELQKELSE